MSGPYFANWLDVYAAFLEGFHAWLDDRPPPEDQARDIGRRLDVRIRMKTFEGVCIMVGHGIGVGIVPRTMVMTLLARSASASMRCNTSTPSWPTART